VAYVQSNGKPRVDLDLNGLTIFIAEVPADATLPTAPSEPYIGLDHLGLRVDDVDAATAELKRRGAQVIVEPKTIRPGVRIAFIQGPDHVRNEASPQQAAGYQEENLIMMRNHGFSNSSLYAVTP